MVSFLRHFRGLLWPSLAGAWRIFWRPQPDSNRCYRRERAEIRSATQADISAWYKSAHSTGFCAVLCMTLGCGEAEVKTPCDGYGCGYDLSSLAGVRFRNHPPTIVYDQTQLERMIVTPYEEVEACAGINADGPLIIVVPNDALNGLGGWTFSDGVIAITDGAVQDGWIVQLQSGIRGPYSVLRHEFVHYLLRASGFPDELNYAHRSPLFMQCAGL